MHILQVTLGFYPATAWGGPVKTVRQAARELVRRGHQVTVYCTNLLDKKRKIQHGTFERTIDGIRVVYFEAWNIPWWPGTLGPAWLPGLPKQMREEIGEIDLIHLNGYRNLMHLPVIVTARRTNTPYIIQPRGSMSVMMNSFLAKRLYDRLIGGFELRGASALIALQESERQQALRLGVPPELIETIPNGLDAEWDNGRHDPTSFRDRFNIEERERIVLFLARINKKKGTDMLIEAYRRADLPDTRLVIAGPDDGQLAEVEALIERYGLGERVILTGLLDEVDCMAAMKSADAFALPCRTDTFPAAIMEACLAETPMVVSDQCEIAYLLKDRVAVVTTFDADAFARGMEILLRDRQRYKAYKRNCKTVFEEEFSLKAVVDKLERLYEKVVGECSEKGFLNTSKHKKPGRVL